MLENTRTYRLIAVLTPVSGQREISGNEDMIIISRAIYKKNKKKATNEWGIGFFLLKCFLSVQDEKMVGVYEWFCVFLKNRKLE